MRDAHPGFTLGLRLILECLLPVPLRIYSIDVLFPIVGLDTGWLMASAAPSTCNATRELYVIGHSAGSFSAMVISELLKELQFSPFYQCTRATAVALPLSSSRHIMYKGRSICATYWKTSCACGDPRTTLDIEARRRLRIEKNCKSPRCCSIV